MGYLTPNDLSGPVKVRALRIPNDPDFLAAFTGALLPLFDPENWESSGAITPDEAAQAAQNIVLQSLFTEYDE